MQFSCSMLDTVMFVANQVLNLEMTTEDIL